MPAIRDCPLLSETYSAWEDFTPVAGAAYVHGASVEERSHHPPGWEMAQRGVHFVQVVNQEPRRVTVSLAGGPLTAFLRSTSRMAALMDALPGSSIYLDITGLSHHVWAPLLRVALTTGKLVRAVYVEPAEYRFSETPTEGEIFDLSEAILGISPLPGFTSLAQPRHADSVCFVPLLGFEGNRLQYVLEMVQPPGQKVIPIVGVPGFRPEYPFYTYMGNRSALEGNLIWSRIRYAKANCPFSLFYALEDISTLYPDELLKIAPIGTKPHALGAVLYALYASRAVELVYDHPVRKVNRTVGSANIHVYDVSSMGTLYRARLLQEGGVA